MVSWIRFLTGFFVGVIVMCVYCGNRIQTAYERGKASVFVECAASGHSTMYTYQMTCSASKIQTAAEEKHERIYTPL